MAVSEYEVRAKRTLLVLLSPCTLRLLTHMKSPLYTKLSHLDMSQASLKS
jgi:hypothetical protein